MNPQCTSPWRVANSKRVSAPASIRQKNIRIAWRETTATLTPPSTGMTPRGNGEPEFAWGILGDHSRFRTARALRNAGKAPSKVNEIRKCRLRFKAEDFGLVFLDINAK